MNGSTEGEFNGSHQPLRIDWRLDPALVAPIRRAVHWLVGRWRQATRRPAR